MHKSDMVAQFSPDMRIVSQIFHCDSHKWNKYFFISLNDYRQFILFGVENTYNLGMIVCIILHNTFHVSYSNRDK